MAITSGVPAAPDPGHALMADDHAARMLGITIEVPAQGVATARMLTSPEMGNGHGIVHGGYLFTLADTAFAFALNSHGRPGVSVHADIAFLLPARVGAELVAHATERVFDGRAGIYDVEVRDGDGALLAEVRVHGRIPARPHALRGARPEEDR
jgi:phenylacetic acid degradation protein PaaD